MAIALVALTASVVMVACIPPHLSSAGCVASTILDRPAESRAAFSVTSAPQRIEGRVLEAGNESPIGNANVTLWPTGRATRTDAQGTFEFDDVPAGSYRLLTDATAYDSRSDSIGVSVGHGVKGDVQLTLRPSPSAACQARVPTPR